MNAVERFLKYVSFGTNSDENSAECPSTPSQLVLGRYIASELERIGLSDAHVDENGYVSAFLPASEGCGALPAIGFVSHIDTSSAVPGDNIKPRTVFYGGGVLTLENGLTIDPAEYPCLASYEGSELIVTDGNTLLGADDKAGVAEIVTALEYLANHPEIKHGRIPVCFTPDEEIGRGTDRFDVKAFNADWAYTVDGGALGEIEYENFNAASAKFRINGVNIHPGSAKNRMKNACLVASQLVTMLPAAEAPAHTEGYEGFYHVCAMSGDESAFDVSVIIRDHDRAAFESRKAFVQRLADYLNGVYGENTVELTLRDSYYNMKEKIEPHMHIIDSAEKAFAENGITPRIVAIRGGTDGARLSFMGLPCPNLSTGGENFHSVREFIPVSALGSMVDVIVTLASVR